MGTELAAGFPERDVGPVPGTSTGRALSVGVASLRPISEWRVFRPKPAAELPQPDSWTVRAQCGVSVLRLECRLSRQTSALKPRRYRTA